MKKLIFSFILFLSFSSLVYADTIEFDIANRQDDVYQSSVLNTIYNDIIPNDNHTYYTIIFRKYFSGGNNYNDFIVYFYNNVNSLYEGFSTTNVGDIYNVYAITDSDKACYINNTSNNTQYGCNTNGLDTRINIVDYSSTTHSYYYNLYDSNYPFYVHNPINMRNFYSDDISLVDDDRYPYLKDLSLYSSWSDYQNNHLVDYTEVNLDNYEYVLLSLKNYNQSEPFQTNLFVKGQIGITPIYNYGQSSKDSVTGVQVQDRCNVPYDSYTPYPFYILESDLQNNAIYAVKSCASESSFKFDSTIFDITYVTSETASNPTITIGGNTYDVIPYNDLPSTATKNESDNYIPGQSGNASDLGGLDSAIKTAQQSLSSIWATLTYFTGLVGMLFSSLPTQLQGILLTAFIVTLTIGIIKLFVK